MNKHDVEIELLRICASNTFNNKAQEKALLRCLVNAALENKQLNVYAIGVDCLGRPESFDPNADSTVRGTYKKLRQRLIEYYLTEGQYDPIMLRTSDSYQIFFEPNPIPDDKAIKKGMHSYPVEPKGEGTFEITTPLVTVELIVSDASINIRILKVARSIAEYRDCASRVHEIINSIPAVYRVRRQLRVHVLAPTEFRPAASHTPSSSPVTTHQVQKAEASVMENSQTVILPKKPPKIGNG